jgi:hypothetical protein
MTSKRFLEHIGPILRDWLEEEERVTGQPHWLVQDNAPCHAAKATLAQFQEWGIKYMDHPPSSADLNLAETSRTDCVR